MASRKMNLQYDFSSLKQHTETNEIIIDQSLRITKLEKTYKDGRKASGYLIDQMNNKHVVVTREFGRDSIFIKEKGFDDENTN